MLLDNRYCQLTHLICGFLCDITHITPMLFLQPIVPFQMMSEEKHGAVSFYYDICHYV